jgi:hypothetical protein
MTMSNEDAPGKAFYVPTKSNTVADPAGPFRAFYVGVAGNVKITDYDGNDIVFTGVLAGMLYPFGGTRVWDTGTTATSLVCVSVNDH